MEVPFHPPETSLLGEWNEISILEEQLVRAC